MKFSKITLAITLAASGHAFAASNQTNSCQGNCATSVATPATAPATVNNNISPSTRADAAAFAAANASNSIKNSNSNSNSNSLSSDIRSTNALTNTISTAAKQGQEQSVKNAANNTGTANITITEAAGIHYSGKYRTENVSGIALAALPSGPCTGASGGVSFAFPGVSAAANGGGVDYSCTQREAARIAAALGRPDIANAILMDMDVVKAALAHKAAEQKKAEVAPSQAVAGYTGNDPIVIRRLTGK